MSALEKLINIENKIKDNKKSFKNTKSEILKRCKYINYFKLLCVTSLFLILTIFFLNYGNLLFEDNLFFDLEKNFLIATRATGSFNFLTFSLPMILHNTIITYILFLSFEHYLRRDINNENSFFNINYSKIFRESPLGFLITFFSFFSLFLSFNFSNYYFNFVYVTAFVFGFFCALNLAGVIFSKTKTNLTELFKLKKAYSKSLNSLELKKELLISQILKDPHSMREAAIEATSGKNDSVNNIAKNIVSMFDIAKKNKAERDRINKNIEVVFKDNININTV